MPQVRAAIDDASIVRRRCPPKPRSARACRCLVRHVLRLHDLTKRRVVRVMHRGIEQRPWLGARQQRGHRGGHEIAIIPVVGGGIGGAAFARPPCRSAAAVRTSSLSAARAQTRSCSPPDTLVFLRSGYRSVSSRNSPPMVSTASATISLSPAGIAVAEHGGEIVDLLQRRAGAVALIGLRAVAHRREIGDEIASGPARTDRDRTPDRNAPPPDRSCRSGRRENTAR